MSARMGAADWLEHGLAQLAQHGPEAVKLEAICESAGKTRGSFYHHFKDMDGFLHAMAQHWYATRVAALIADVSVAEMAQMSAEETVALVMQLDYRMELGLRELARRDDGVARVMAKGDAERLAVSAQALALKFGLDEAEAAQAAMLDYAAFSGVMLLNPDMSREAQVRLCALYMRMVEAYQTR